MEKKTIFYYLQHVMIVYGVAVVSQVLFCTLFGEDARGYSSMFALGSEGIPVALLVEFLVLAVMITILRWIFFTDTLIKQCSITVRTVLMFLCVILVVGAEAALFHWFPVDQVKPWCMFLLCFLVCAVASVGITTLMEKSENKKMQEALERMKGEN